MLFARILALVAPAFLMPVAAHASTLVLDLDAQINSNDSSSESDLSNFLAIDLTPGTYEITPVIGEFEALTVWDKVTGCVDGKDCTEGWFWLVNVVSESGTDFDTLRFGLSETIFDAPAAAFAAAQANGPASFTLTQSDTVFFGFFDTPSRDNRGGVSFELDRLSAVPLPATALALIAACGLLGGLRARRR